MSETQEPKVIPNIPEAVSKFASDDQRVTLNSPANGHIVSEELTDFILYTPRGIKIAILFRGTDGRVFTQIGTFDEIRTLSREELKHGMDAEILLSETRHRHPRNLGVTLVSSIIAIARLSKATRPTPMHPDLDGNIFISMLTRAQ